MSDSQIYLANNNIGKGALKIIIFTPLHHMLTGECNMMMLYEQNIVLDNGNGVAGIISTGHDRWESGGH